MPIFIRSALTLVAFVAGPATVLHAQMLEPGDAPRVLSTPRLTRQELNHRKALTLYGLARQRLKEDRLVEATHLLEDARELDADSAPIHKALVPLYLGWLASFVQQTRDQTADAAEQRVERLCLAFEAQKPYLIARWRWPERLRM